jgi:hypothetical protein
MNKFNKPPLFDRNHHNHNRVVKNFLRVAVLVAGLGASALGLALTGHNSLPKDAKTIQVTETFEQGVVFRADPYEDPSNGDYVTTVKQGETIKSNNPVEVKTINGEVFHAIWLNGQTLYVDVTQVNKQSLEEGKKYIIDSSANSTSTNFLPTKVEGNRYEFKDPKTGIWKEAGQSVTISNNN